MVMSSWIFILAGVALLAMAIVVMLVVAVASKSKGGAAVAVALLAGVVLALPCLALVGWMFLRVGPGWQSMPPRQLAPPRPVRAPIAPPAPRAQPAQPTVMFSDEAPDESLPSEPVDSPAAPVPAASGNP